MKNIILISNVNNKNGEKNYINHFTTTLPGQIDAINNKKYISVLNVFYPKTAKNINEDECWCDLELKFSKYFIQTDNTTKNIDKSLYPILKFNLPRIKIPAGIYNNKKVLAFLNDYLNDFNVFFDNKNGKNNIVLTNEYSCYYAQGKESYIKNGKKYDFKNYIWTQPVMNKIEYIDYATGNNTLEFKLTFSKKLILCWGWIKKK